MFGIQRERYEKALLRTCGWLLVNMPRYGLSSPKATGVSRRRVVYAVQSCLSGASRENSFPIRLASAACR